MGRRQTKVLLLKYTPEPESTVSMSAKLCYSPIDIDALKEKIESIEQSRFVEKLMKMGHLSPIEHAVFTFAIEGISRACSHQLVRHRIASYSQQSQRYVSEKTEGDTFDYIIPPTISEDEEIKNIFENFMIEAQKTYNLIVNRLNERGLKGESANQDARFVLPNACETKIIVTMNARELLHFFRQRCCNRAQWEIRLMAEEMLQLVKEVAPTIFKNAGPPCLKHPCPEGEYSCGKIEEVRKKYGY